MTRDEHRAKCIEVMQKAATANPLVIDWWGAFDSLHGIAFVCPIEATVEMINAAEPVYDDTFPQCADNIYKAMAAAGDLTKPPEPKP
jgi:hypothetical protein